MRPSYLDFQREPPVSGIPSLPRNDAAALQGMTEERNAARARISDLEQRLAATESELHAVTLRADEAIQQINPLHDSLSAMEADKAVAEKRAAEADVLAQDAENRRGEAQRQLDGLNSHLADVEALLEHKTAALAEAESQIAELTKPKEPTDDPPAKSSKKGQ